MKNKSALIQYNSSLGKKMGEFLECLLIHGNNLEHICISGHRNIPLGRRTIPIPTILYIMYVCIIQNIIETVVAIIFFL